MQSEKKSEKGLFFLTVRCFACVFVCVLLVCGACGVRLDYPGPGVTDGCKLCRCGCPLEEQPVLLPLSYLSSSKDFKKKKTK